MADDLRSIFYASSRKKADEFAGAFAAKWEKDIPTAVKCLSNSLDRCLTFFSFPEEEWNNQCHRAAEQGVQKKDKTDGDCRWGKRLLSSPGIHITEDGDELEDNKDRKGTSEFAPL